MKRLVTAVLLGILAVGLSACAGASLGDKAPVNFPAQGYEFAPHMGG